MTITHLLEDFTVYASSTTVEMTDVLLEEQRLEAFEKGYQAGWDDSVAAKQSETGQVSSEFSLALADLSFTYDDAFSGLAKGVEPLLQKIVQAVLPKIAQQSLGPRLSELLSAAVEKHGRVPVTLSVAPGQKDALQNIADDTPDLNVSITSDSTLMDGQLRLSFDGGDEQEIDIPGLIKDVSEAIETFFNSDATHAQKETA